MLSLDIGSVRTITCKLDTYRLYKATPRYFEIHIFFRAGNFPETYTSYSFRRTASLCKGMIRKLT